MKGKATLLEDIAPNSEEVTPNPEIYIGKNYLDKIINKKPSMEIPDGVSKKIVSTDITRKESILQHLKEEKS